jgi:hypothetical protein
LSTRTYQGNSVLQGDAIAELIICSGVTGDELGNTPPAAVSILTVQEGRAGVRTCRAIPRFPNKCGPAADCDRHSELATRFGILGAEHASADGGILLKYAGGT